MTSIRIEKKRVRNIDFVNNYNIEKLKIYENVTEEYAKDLGFSAVGDVIIPSEKHGTCCYKNVNGYSYPDKSKPKERRIVASIYVSPFGNKNAEEILVDIPRECYPQIAVAPYEIELELLKTDSGKLYVSVILTEKVKTCYLKEAINLMLEIFGGCYIGDDITFSDMKRRRVNWIMLPPGTKPSEHIRDTIIHNNEQVNQYVIDRFEYLEACEIEEIVEGLNSFQGYYAFLMGKYCVLESAIYGNATYILKRENWEELSKKSKGELLEKQNVIARIEHTKNWKRTIKNKMVSLGLK